MNASKRSPPRGFCANLALCGLEEAVDLDGVSPVGRSLLAVTADVKRDIVGRPFHCPCPHPPLTVKVGKGPFPCSDGGCLLDRHVIGGAETPIDLLAHVHKNTLLARLQPTSEPVTDACCCDNPEQCPRRIPTPKWMHYLSMGGNWLCRYCERVFEGYWSGLSHHITEHLRLPPDAWFQEAGEKQAPADTSGIDLNCLDPSARIHLEGRRMLEPPQLLFREKWRCYYPNCEKDYAAGTSKKGFMNHMIAHDERTCLPCLQGDPIRDTLRTREVPLLTWKVFDSTPKFRAHLKNEHGIGEVIPDSTVEVVKPSDSSDSTSTTIKCGTIAVTRVQECPDCQSVLLAKSMPVHRKTCPCRPCRPTTTKDDNL